MKILFANMLDPMTVRGHKNLDVKIMSLLSEIAEVTVICPKRWYINLPETVIEYNVLYDSKLTGRRLRYDYSVKVIHAINSLDSNNKFNYILFGSFDNYMTAIALFKIKKSKDRVFIIHHGNIDNIEKSRRADFVFRRYCRAVNHIVLGEYIAEHLEDVYAIKDDLVHYFPMPLYNKLDFTVQNRIYDCVGISNSNDERWILKLLELEMETHWFVKNQIRVVIRSAINEYDDGCLIIIKGYLSDEEYMYYYSNAKSVFLPFSNNYRYKMSGTITDALSNGSVVIGTRNMMMEWYCSKYPVICKIVNSVEEFLSVFKEGEYEATSHEFEDFLSEHNDEYLKRILESFLAECGGY